MKRLARRVLILALLAWFPVQASAMPWLAHKCDQHDTVVHDHGMQHTDHAQHAADGGHDDTGHAGDSGASVHSCCHHHFAAIVPLAPTTGEAATSAVAPALPAHSYQFFPEPLKRPPLAELA